MTLAFYGEVPGGAVDELALQLDAVAAELGPLAVQLAGAGVFSGTALWAGVRDADRPEPWTDDDPAGGLLALMARCEAAGEGISRLEPRDRRRAHLTLARLGRRGQRDGGRRDAFRGRPAWAGTPGAGGRGGWGGTDRWGPAGGPGADGRGAEAERGSDWHRGGGRRRQAGPARTGRSRREPPRPGVDLDAVVHALSVYRGPVWTATELELVASRLGEGRGGGAHHEVLATFPLAGA